MLDNVGTIVSSLVSKEQVDRQASDELLQHTFPRQQWRGGGADSGQYLIKMDENRVWIYYMSTFFEAKRLE